MKVVFLRSADRGLRWFTRYYAQVFPEGARGAAARMRQSLLTLADNPEIGPTTKHGARKLVIHNTPFSLLYQVNDDQIEVLHVVDGRANPDEPFQPRDDEEPSR